MTGYAYVFPGQGAQSIGMMAAWDSDQSIVNDVYQQASEKLGYDLWQVISQGPDSRLNQTEVTQPAMLCAGVACWRIAQQQGGLPAAAMMAGHSLGEYTALVCAESLNLGDAIALVARRGQLMQTAVQEGAGLMAVIIGLEDEQVIAACASIKTGVVEAVNFNAPGQVVIAGEKSAVESAMNAAKDLGAKRALPLSLSVPSHCSLMKPAAEELASQIAALELKMPAVPVVHNQNAEVANSVEEIIELLSLQVWQPVKWVASVQRMHQQGITRLIEFGPGKVLSGLARRIEKSLEAYPIYDAQTLAKTQQILGE